MPCCCFRVHWQYSQCGLIHKHTSAFIVNLVSNKATCYMNRTFHSWTMYVIFSFSWLLFEFNQTNPRLHLVQHVWPVIIKCSDKMNCKSLCSWQHLQNHQQDDHCTLSFLFQADCWVPLDSTSALCRVSADSLHPSNPATITNQLIVVLLSHWTLRQFSLPLIALIIVAIMQVLTRISQGTC